MKYFLIFLTSIFFIACEQSADTDKNRLSNDLTTPSKIQQNAPGIVQPTGKVFEYGIYTAQRKGRVRDSLNSNTGKIISKPVLKLSKTTKRIPLLKDTYFAYRYRLLDLPREEVKKPTVELRKILIHPQMTLPDGSKTTGWDRVIRGRTSVGQVIAFDGYVFNEDYELVEGDWIFQIWYKDKKLVEHVFSTYKPGSEKHNLASTSLP